MNILRYKFFALRDESSGSGGGESSSSSSASDSGSSSSDSSGTQSGNYGGYTTGSSDNATNTTDATNAQISYGGLNIVSHNEVAPVIAAVPPPIPLQPIAVANSSFTLKKAATILGGAAALTVPGLGLFGLAAKTSAASAISDSFSNGNNDGNYHFVDASSNSDSGGDVGVFGGSKSGSGSIAQTYPKNPAYGDSVGVNPDLRGNSATIGTPSFTPKISQAELSAAGMPAQSNPVQTAATPVIVAPSKDSALSILAAIATIFAVLRT